jgi:lipase ATG15
MCPKDEAAARAAGGTARTSLIFFCAIGIIRPHPCGRATPPSTASSTALLESFAAIWGTMNENSTDDAVETDGRRGDDGLMEVVEVEAPPSPDQQQQRDEAPPLQFQDHFTLRNPSDTVRFRSSSVQVHELRNSQLQIVRDQDDGGKVTVKDVRNDRSFALSMLRGTYSLFCLFFSGILFILCFQVLLYLFMDLVRNAGLTDVQGNVSKFIGTLLAVPVFVYGLASAMSIAAAWVADAWSGNAFFKTVGNWDSIWTEWAVLIALLGVPLVTWIVALFAGSDDSWQVTALTWFCCVSVYYVIFCCAILYYEIQAAWLVLRELDPAASSNGLFSLLARAVLHRQIYQLSGSQRFVRVQVGEDSTTRLEERGFPSLYSFMTRASCCSRLFETVEPPERMYSTDDILGTRQFVTTHSWDLSKIFCSNSRIRSVAVVRGPSALRPNQMKSSFVCAIGGSILVLLLFVALIVYLEGAGLLIFFLVVIIICCCIPRVKNTRRIYKVYKDVLDTQQEGKENHSTARDDQMDGISQSYEMYRITRPTRGFCWLMFGLEVGLLFLWPLVTLFVIKNRPIVSLFIVVSVISMVRYYLNAAILIKELGSFERIGQDEKDKVKQWKVKARLSTILMNVTRGPTRHIWMWIFVVLAVCLIVFAVFSLGTSTEDAESSDEDVVILPRGDFVYEPQPDLPYPTCRLAKGLEIPSSNSTALADYAFLAAMAYQREDTFQDNLDAWFGPGVAANQPGIVDQFRSGVEGGQAAVDYRFVTFPGYSFGVVVVRGSTTSWEWLTDAQLWSAAALVGLYRWVLPVGSIFNPVLPQVLKAISWVESDSLDKVALYRQTTSFVEALQASKNYTTIHITGQSLGGGIALITAAQTGIPGIAVSGPNCLLSRKTFDPELTVRGLLPSTCLLRISHRLLFGIFRRMQSTDTSSTLCQIATLYHALMTWVYFTNESSAVDRRMICGRAIVVCDRSAKSCTHAAPTTDPCCVIAQLGSDIRQETKLLGTAPSRTYAARNEATMVNPVERLVANNVLDALLHTI